MQFTTQTLLAILGSVSTINAHMIMSTPVPFGKSTLNNSPLAADGSDFPCKQRTGVYAMDNPTNEMALGSSQPLAFTGSATHGGGSCQISITYDSAPTKNSVWKVIHSIEGGCPIQNVAGNNGNDANAADPSTYKFTIPTTLPTGAAVLAWTWNNKIGNREMYMNCAPITLTSGSSKRTVDEEDLVANITQLMARDTAAYDALPDMFVANIGNGCTTVDSTDVLYPNPGDSVEQLGLSTKSALSAPTGTGCGKAVAASSVATSAAIAATTNAASSAAVAATTNAVSVASSSVIATTNAGGVFVTTGPSSAVATTLATSIATVASSSAAAVATSTTSSGVSGVQSGACTNEGAWNCIGGTEFQRCASGQWSVAMPVAAGTTCGSSGIEANINIVASSKQRRRSRNSHVRRHIQLSS